MNRTLFCLALAGCGSSGGGATNPGDASNSDASPDAVSDAATSSSPLGMVTGVTTVTCPSGAPTGATCQQVSVSGCPGIETEAIDATIAVVAEGGTRIGTVTHCCQGEGLGTGAADAANALVAACVARH